MELTKAAKKALTILDVGYGQELSAVQFARLMWPDSSGWNRVANKVMGPVGLKGCGSLPEAI